MEFAAFADRARAIEETDADLAVVAAVAELFADADDDLATVARYVQGRPFPAWDDRTLAVGPSLCHEALARAADPNVDADDVEDRLADVGEIGAVAASLELGGQQGLSAFGAGGSEDLTVAEVGAEFEAMAAATGSGSEGNRRDRLFGLFNRANPTEARFLARLVLAEMRIGVGEGTVRDAIAGAFLADDWPSAPDATEAAAGGAGTEDDDANADADDGGVEQLTLADAAATGDGDEGGDDDEDDDEGGDEDEGAGEDEGADEAGGAAEDSTPAAVERPPADAVAAVERALQVSNDCGRVAEVAREEGREGLERMELEVGRPVQAMLAQAGAVMDVVKSWDGVAVETKYDGARVQVHHDPRGETRLFSRNMEDVTAALPEIVDYVRATVDVPVILDGEVIAVDDGDVLPFQRVLERFRRKHDVAAAREDVAVELRAFDCLHHDGTDLLDAPLQDRRRRLEHAMDGASATYAVMYDPDKIDAFEAAVLDEGHEGIMLKDPDSTYSAGKRGQEWLKRKPDVETLDVVVTGAEWGEGRRANVFGTFEVSVRVPDDDGRGDAGDGRADASDGSRYATIGNVATGITDAELDSLTERLREHVRTEDGQTVTFDPAVVFEVGYEEIQASPTSESGYALRFPRFVAVREDKAPADADDLARVDRLVED
ncbi:ATP-dependent DNA ligase [Halorubellus sp. JP-L1]|uniref:ATP-dependent DNA ligase n=1 Tax=Halorubellus sp. JP-L1 TaxID=2715753 RepID=UPI00140C5379|nr:ATP-dependent DNA ligase [Halorubellus sp. JP-L1]NHN40766.1 ATP-dependent DNA ligase [Halorubellus sp. JP-L1]